MNGQIDHEHAPVELEDKPKTAFVDAQVVPKRIALRVWQRLLIALAILLGFGGLGVAVWLIGMLMFTFSLDGANPSDIPAGLEIMMLAVWPLSIIPVAVVPAILMACGAKWRWIVGAFFGFAFFSAGIYIAGVIMLFSSLGAN